MSKVEERSPDSAKVKGMKEKKGKEEERPGRLVLGGVSLVVPELFCWGGMREKWRKRESGRLTHRCFYKKRGNARSTTESEVWYSILIGAS